MYNLFKKSLLAISAIVLFGACKKDLNEISPDNSVPFETAFSNADKCLVALYGVYDAAQSGAYVDGTVRGYPFGAANISQGDNRGEDVVNVAAFYQLTYLSQHNSTSANVVGMWNSLYALINKANVCIEGFRGAGSAGILTAAVANQYEGEMRFLRALAHHEAVINWARPYADNNGQNPGVPYRNFALTTPQRVDSIRKMPRMRVDSVYRNILIDLDSAESKLPAAVSPSTVRATKAAAIALKMRVKLHMGNWAGVIAEGAKLVPATVTPSNPAGTVSPIGGWALTAAADGPFTDNASKESIFSVRNDALDNTGVNGALPSMFGAANLGARGLVAVSPIIWNDTSAWKCNDTRRSLLYGGGINANGNNSNIFTSKYRKYSTRDDFAPQIRYAEVLLTLAEAEARNNAGVSSRAVDLLNVVRNRSLASPTTQQYTVASFPDQVSLIKAILTERRVEFLAEGKRWADITRNALDANYAVGGIPAKMANGTAGLALYGCGSAAATAVAPIAYTDFRFIWPIPNEEIVGNPIITQNPLY